MSKMGKTGNRVIIGLVFLLILASVASLSIGAIQIPAKNLGSMFLHKMGLAGDTGFSAQQEAVLFGLRMPRLLLGMMIGATLSVCGTAIQGLFRNPLAEPGLIGISAGATLFAVLVIVLETRYLQFLTALFGYYSLGIAAFFGATLTTFLVYRFSVQNGKTNVTTLLLIGIAINALVGAITGLLTYIASDEQLRSITFWSLGSLGGATWKAVFSVLPFALVTLTGLSFFRKPLNAMVLGESQAEHLGIPLQRIKKYIIVLSAIGVGACVAAAGMIGFIALVVPHILRISVSSNHYFVLPASALLGASVLVVSDLLARTIAAPSELPIGILTAIIGVPVFIYIIIKSNSIKSTI